MTPKRTTMSAGRIALLVLASLLVLAGAVWGAFALWYQVPAGTALKGIVAGLWAAFGLAAITLMWRGQARRGLLFYAVGFAALLSWWAGIEPSKDRVWADDVSQYLRGRVDGPTVTLQNVRNFEWRSDTDYTQRWEARSYDLGKLRSVDMALSYWMGPAIAHTLVSFGFDGGRYVTFSIEIRKERGETFSAIAGFFKKFETSLIAADERDILRVRTNVRGEDMLMFRVAMQPEQMRSLFLAYVDEAALLEREPRFYNTLIANCTTIVFEMVRRIVPGLPMDYRLLASGWLPEYLHDVGGLMPGYSVQQLREAGRFTDRAKAADGALEFSQAIRVGVPGASRAVP